MYSSTGSERNISTAVNGRILLIDNCLEFKLKDGKIKEKVVVLHDFRHSKGSVQAFKWNGRWSQEDREKMWSQELKEALGYADIYKGQETKFAMPLRDFVALFNSSVVLHGTD